MTATIPLFTEEDAPTSPELEDTRTDPPSSLLEEFERWMTQGSGLAFYNALDRIALDLALGGEKHANAWQTIYQTGRPWRHDYEPFITRLWMISHDAHGFFRTRDLKDYTEGEVEAVCRRILDAWARREEVAA